MKVYELAQELGVSNSVVVRLLRKNGIGVSTMSQKLDDEAVEIVRAEIKFPETDKYVN